MYLRLQLVLALFHLTMVTASPSSAVTISPSMAKQFLVDPPIQVYQSNSGFLEELTLTTDFERECVQERCNFEELDEAVNFLWKDQKLNQMDSYNLQLLKIKNQVDFKKYKQNLLYNQCYRRIRL